MYLIIAKKTGSNDEKTSGYPFNKFYFYL